MADSAELPSCTIESRIRHKITNRLDLSWANAAATTDQPCACVEPVLDIVGLEGGWASPGLDCGIPAFTAIGIDHDRLGGSTASDADQGVRVGRVDAVGSHGDNLVDVP